MHLSFRTNDDDGDAQNHPKNPEKWFFFGLFHFEKSSNKMANIWDENYDNNKEN